MKKFKDDVVIIGGLGHVGLPLGIVFAEKGLKVCLHDLDKKKANMLKKGQMPFIEYGSEKILKKVLKNGHLKISGSKKSIKDARWVIIAIGTPLDEYLNPRSREFLNFFKDLTKFLHKDQTIIVRSTVFPRTCEQMQGLLGEDWKIAYCPERIVQGYAIEELAQLPQIVSGLSKEAETSVAKLFKKISPEVILTSVAEAEMVKLFSNAWRYIQFAVSNQFYMICERRGVDFYKVRDAMTAGYDRAKQVPRSGFAAGPCLLKDTMQLCAFGNNSFLLGQTAMMINEGMPNYIVENLTREYDSLEGKKIGILGMAFKSEIDDIRDSLSYKLGKELRFANAEVYYSDEYVEDPTFVKKDKILDECEIIIIGVCHNAYREITVPKNTKIVDLWGMTQVVYED